VRIAGWAKSSTSNIVGLEFLLMNRFMDLDASSPRTAERKISIRDPPLRKITQQD
jgi:hypothetical protein